MSKPTTEQRLRWVRHRTFPGGWYWLGLAAILLALTPFVTAGPAWALPALAGVCLACVSGYAAIQWLSGGSIVETRYGEYRFYSRKYFEPPEKLEEFTLEWWMPHRPQAQRYGLSLDTFADGLEVDVFDGPAEFDSGGATYTATKTVRLAGQGILGQDHAHELDHVLVFALFHDSHDLKRMTHDERIALLEAR